jgi:hypothetical protein
VELIRLQVTLQCTASQVSSSVENAARITVKHGSTVIATGTGRVKGHKITAKLHARRRLTGNGHITITISVPGWIKHTVVHATVR